jgi:hypothetical protein
VLLAGNNELKGALVRGKGVRTDLSRAQASGLVNATLASRPSFRGIHFLFCAIQYLSFPAFTWRTSLTGEELFQLLVLGSVE